MHTVLAKFFDGKNFLLIGAIVALLIQSGKKIPIFCGYIAVCVVGQTDVGRKIVCEDIFCEVDWARATTGEHLVATTACLGRVVAGVLLVADVLSHVVSN